MGEIQAQNEPTLSSAVEHVLGSTQKALVSRMELLQVEAQEDFFGLLHGAGIVAAGAGLLLVGWHMLMGLVLLWLNDLVGLATGLCVMVILNLALGSAIAGYGIRFLGRIRLMAPDKPMPIRHAAVSAAGRSGPS